MPPVAAASDDAVTVFSPPPLPYRKAETESGKLVTVKPTHSQYTIDSCYYHHKTGQELQDESSYHIPGHMILQPY